MTVPRGRIVFAFLTLLTSTTIGAELVHYQILPGGDNRVALEVEKTRLMKGKKHLFLAGRYQGRLSYNAGAPEQSKVELTVESASLVCQDTWVKPKDLQEIQRYALEKMLAAGKYPEIRFSSQAIHSLDDHRFEVSGPLTIRGREKPVHVIVKMERLSGGDLQFEGSAAVKMKDYGLKPPSAALGMVGTKNEMTLSFSLRASPIR